MPPYHQYTHSAGTGIPNPYSNTRPSSTNFPATATPSMHMNMNMHGTTNPAYSGSGSGSAAGTGSSMSATKTRQYAQLHASLAQLNANLSDTQNLVRMTAVQAQDMRFLGGYVGALFMGSAKVLGEEGVKVGSGAGAGTAAKSEEDADADGDVYMDGEGVVRVKRES
ncbi:hypothetical protein P170DRAFT_475539 [Aspergillus steynii IBT 23096]|uniref:DASH complex subunit Hsk3 like-domain-containing protein n=1 Tax=Aspergillus steynii IBT 23096 TaxID=1392250 RepID=A0A2I2G8M1_9EURO|nr:uncharacterized protein P170DRAFT_475539 [Aspergillus steynii IBT 23096]PLB49231.1 hypothetical protein P170DRAFT_475539 [Aspergillus steynii IBT 23096]